MITLDAKHGAFDAAAIIAHLELLAKCKASDVERATLLDAIGSVKAEIARLEAHSHE